uniref:DUF4218 domain-containing protein n=1 Tax=Lactuca sativa TaxID=4236 RepID=A0A9R1WK43_LACSA|nr:hypothetical protein LSAT_V11C100049470 [Lactuca sativa]
MSTIMPQPSSGEDIFVYLAGFETTWGKKIKPKKIGLNKIKPKKGVSKKETAKKEKSKKKKKGLKSNIKVPHGYCSNFKNLMLDDVSKMNGLKSNDCHVLMQQLLPFSIKGVLDLKVRRTILSLYHFFNELCSKVIDVSKLGKLQSDIVLTLCLLEKYFPPSFFDVMNHLMVHLVREVRLCGPVHFRWMYPFERYMKTLKGQHMLELKDLNPCHARNSTWLQSQHSRKFISWFKKEVGKRLANGENICDDVRWLAKGPNFAIASAKDSNLVYVSVTYFGRIKEIQDLDYRMFTIPVFMCDWVDSRRVKKDILDSWLCFCDMESDSTSDQDEESKQRCSTTKEKANKVKLVVTYNKKGVPVGKEATKLSTFEGLVARTMVPITYESWLEVNDEVICSIITIAL